MIAAGLGCRAGCPVADIVAAVRRAAAENGVAVAEVRALYSADFKASEPGLRRAADALGKPLLFLSTLALAEHAASVATRSERVLERFGLPSVAETAALAGAFELGEQRAPVRLLSARHLAGGASCALARPELAP